MDNLLFSIGQLVAGIVLLQLDGIGRLVMEVVMTRYLSVGEVSELLRVSTKWLYRMLNRREIPGAFRIGKVWFIDQEVLIQGLRDKAAKPVKSRS